MSYDWDVTRTTTDKLAETLNDLAWEIYQVQFTGGRDWVVIQREKVEPDDEPDDYGIELSPADLEFAPFHIKGDAVNVGPRGIRITHLPTGATITAGGHQSQLENKAQALRELKVRVASLNRY